MKPSRRSHPAVFFLLILFICPFLCWHLTEGNANAQNASEDGQSSLGRENVPLPTIQSHMVVVDGYNLFRVAGIESYPAKKRANKITRRIIQAAKDSSFDPANLEIRKKNEVYSIYAGDLVIARILSTDVALEGEFSPDAFVNRLVKKQIVKAIERYRHERLPETLKANAIKALYRTIGLIVILLLLFWSFKKSDQLLERRFKRKIDKLESKSKRILQAQQIWNVLSFVIRISKVAFVLIVIYIFLHFVLGLFPWTRFLALTLLSYVIKPLEVLWQSFVDYLPSLFFLIIIYLLFRYLLSIAKAFFDQIDRGRLKISGFDAEWAFPTYRLVKVLVIIFALVIAYPYIPGSGSEAFKGISILIGVLFSLGSSSLIANIIAGYTMTYRRAFKVGDRVKFGEHVGDVTDIYLMETHIRSLKNEEIIIPNSAILNGDVTNYSSIGRRQGIILHTTVGIGYEVPWRQVEAMLLMAAQRTQGLPRRPEPFVLQKSLGDFGVNYELNVYCRNAEKMPQIYSELHGNIQDVFNEYGVAIMTPHYVGDTEELKIVKKEDWYASPARPPA